VALSSWCRGGAHNT